MIYELTNNTLPAAALFSGWDETLIWSCLQRIMGSVYADDLNRPTASMAVIGDFTFLPGNRIWSWYPAFRTMKSTGSRESELSSAGTASPYPALPPTPDTVRARN